MAELKLIWENNPDTPISASSLSQFFDHNEEGGIITKDISELMTHGTIGDDMLKIKAYSKIGVRIPNTLAYFDFYNSSVSHDSTYSPVVLNNPIYSEDAQVGLGSIFIGESTTNLLQNAGWEQGINSWNAYIQDGMGLHDFPVGQIDYTIGTGFIRIIGNDHAPKKGSLKALNLGVNEAGRVQVDQLVNLSTYTIASASFYYKSNGGLNFKIESGGLFWKDTDWSNATSSYYTLPNTNGKWVRFEVRSINLNKVSASKSAVTFSFYSESVDTQHFIDSAQVEAKAFCSPYTETSLGSTELQYSGSMIDLQHGLIDIVFKPKSMGDMTLLRVIGLNGPDALSLSYNELTDAIIFKIYDFSTQSYVSAISQFQLANAIDSWIHVVVSWDNNIGLKIIGTNIPYVESATPYTIVPTALLGNIEIGVLDGGVRNYYIDSLKFNFESKQQLAMTQDVNRLAYIEPNTYKTFEVTEQSIILDELLLDTGEAYNPDTIYYVFIEDMQDDVGARVWISLNGICPLSAAIRYTKLIGGFKTSLDAVVQISSIWDIYTKRTITHTERLEVHGTDSDYYHFDVRTTPWAETNDVRSTIPINFSDTLQGRHFTDLQNNGVPYFESNPMGWVGIDNILTDENKITTRNYNNINNDIVISTYNKASRILLDSSEIQLVSGIGDIKLDNLRIDNNYFYTQQGYDLRIDTTFADPGKNSDIYITTRGIYTHANGNVSEDVYGNRTRHTYGSIADTVDMDSVTMYNTTQSVTAQDNLIYHVVSGVISLDNILFKTNKIYTANDLQVQSISGSVVVSSGTLGIISLDDVLFKNNKIYNNDSIAIESPQNITIGRAGAGLSPNTTDTSLFTTNVIINSDIFTVNSQKINFNNIDASDFIKFDSIKMQQNTILTDGSTSMNITTPNTLTINANSRLYVPNTTALFDIYAPTNFTSNVQITGTLTVNGDTVHNGKVYANGFWLNSIDGTDMAGLYGSHTGANSVAHLQFGKDIADILTIEQFNGSSISPVVSFTSDSMIVYKNLIVQGAITSVKSTNTDVYDSTFTIKVADTPINGNASYEVQRATANAKLAWNESIGRWQVDNGTGNAYDLIYMGYDNRFNYNNTIVVSQGASGFKLQNNNAISGMEMLDVGSTSTGEGTLNVGIHSNGGFISRINATAPESYLQISARNTNGTRFEFKCEDASGSVVKSLATLDNLGVFTVPTIATTNFTGTNIVASTSLIAQGSLIVNNAAPTIILQDTNNVSGAIQCDNSKFYIIGTAGVNSIVPTPLAGKYPLQIDLTTNTATFGGTVIAPLIQVSTGDTAECWIKDEGHKFDFGQVVVRTATGVMPSTKRAQRATLGVVSKDYAVLYKQDGYTGDLDNGLKVPVCICGTVRVNVHGRVRFGDELVSYKYGLATKANWFERVFKRDCIIGMVDSVFNNIVIMKK